MPVRTTRRLTAAVHALLCFLLLASPAALAGGQAAAAGPVTDIPLLDGDIAIDGNIDEGAWQQAASIDLAHEINPGDNTPAPVKTTLRMGYTRDALYLAFDARDPDPSKIRAHLADRDAAFSDDFVGVMLDTFDDQRRAYEIFVNPLGVQMDLIREDATNNEDPSWDGLWTSAGRITPQGYQVEIRIPFSTLRFRDTDGARRWGVLGFRNYPRNIRHQIASARVPRSGSCLMCHADKVEGMVAVEQGRNLEVVPTVTVTDVQVRDSRDGEWHGDGVRVEPGVDVSWAPTPNLTLNATINPDFSQVESDQAQLDLSSNFALYFPEKRPFFMEGADYFNTQFDVLYTRQVADPDYGLRVTGRTGNGAYGAFVARDAVTQLLLPGASGSSFTVLEQPADAGVARYRHDLDPETSIGVIATSRRGDDYGNDVAGVDARWKSGEHSLSGQFLRSDSHYPDALEVDDHDPGGNAWRAAYAFNGRAWSFDAMHELVDPGFRADLGFMGKVGYGMSLLGAGHTWFGDDGARLTRIGLSGDYDVTHRADGQLLEREWEAQLWFNGPLQSSFGLHGLTRQRFWEGSLFDESYLNLYGNFTPRSGIKLGSSFRIGPQIDLQAARRGQGRYIDLWGELSLGLGYSVEFDLFRQDLLRDGGTAFAATVFDTRFGWQIDPRQRLRIAVQGSRIDKDPALYEEPVNAHARNLAAQLIYSYKVNPRTALYAGGTIGGFLDDEQPTLFASSRGVFLKLSYGWQP